MTTAPTTPNPAPHGQWHHCPICNDPLNYEPNPVVWRPGALVLHDADAKEQVMLLVVESVIGHQATARYLQSSPHNRLKQYTNPMCALHDPARWGISTETREATP